MKITLEKDYICCLKARYRVTEVHVAVVAELGTLNGEVSHSSGTRNERTSQCLAQGLPWCWAGACWWGCSAGTDCGAARQRSWGLHGSDASALLACFCSETSLCMKVPSYNGCFLSALLLLAEQGQKYPPAASQWALSNQHTWETRRWSVLLLCIAWAVPFIPVHTTKALHWVEMRVFGAG